MPGFCHVYRDDITEENSYTHTNPKNTELYLYVYVFRKDSETTAVFQIEFMSNNNRIIECFGFERTLKIISFLKDHLLP